MCLQVQGSSGRHVNTVAGYDQLAHQIEALQEEIQRSKSSARRSRNTVESLLGDVRVCLPSLVLQHKALLQLHASFHS